MNTPITKETIEQLKHILSSAPKKATHWDGAYYWQHTLSYGWVYCRGGIREEKIRESVTSLLHMRLIVSLFEENQELKYILESLEK